MNSNKKGRIQRPPTSFFKSENTDEIASYEVSEYDTDINSDNLKKVNLQKVYGNRKIVECISNAMGKPAYDKERNSEK